MINCKGMDRVPDCTLIEISDWASLDPRKLMDIYLESNTDNIDYFYPGVSDREMALAKIEADFLEMLRSDFLDGKNKYMVLESNGTWLSAVRLYPLDNERFYLEALETHPEHRRQGYAAKLLFLVQDRLKARGNFTLLDCVAKTNSASLATHLKCGFRIVSGQGMDYLRNRTNENYYGLSFVVNAEK